MALTAEKKRSILVQAEKMCSSNMIYLAKRMDPEAIKYLPMVTHARNGSVKVAIYAPIAFMTVSGINRLMDYNLLPPYKINEIWEQYIEFLLICRKATLLMKERNVQP